MGRLMREHYWIPFALSAHLVHDAGADPGAPPRRELRRVPRRGRPHRVPRRALPAPPRLARCSAASRATACAASTTGGRSTSRAVSSSARPRPSGPSGSPPASHVDHFPVHEAGGFGVGVARRRRPAAVPRAAVRERRCTRVWCVSRVPCNWLQGVEGTIDSAHVGVLHHTWHERDRQGRRSTPTSASPSTSPRPTRPRRPLRHARRRAPADGDGQHLRPDHRVLHAPRDPRAGRARPTARRFDVRRSRPSTTLTTSSSTGTSRDAPRDAAEEMPACVAPDFVPDPLRLRRAPGRPSNRWGQDRELMDAGHCTGFGRTLLEEDAAVQTSMGPILDRTQGAPRRERRRGGTRPPDPARRVARRRDRRAAARQRLDARRCADAQRARGAVGRGQTMGRHRPRDDVVGAKEIPRYEVKERTGHPLFSLLDGRCHPRNDANRSR